MLFFSLYLELFEFENKSHLIEPCINHFAEKYKDQKVVFSWNHDSDFVKYNHIVEQHENVYILNFNTSVESVNDIILPFWSIDTNYIKEQKKYNYGFIGNTGNHV